MLLLLGKLQNLFPRKTLGPPLRVPQDMRTVEQHLTQPVFGMVTADAAAAQFPDRSVPVTPGAPPTTGLEQVAYDHQPMWDRMPDPVLVGPVRQFFRDMIAAQNNVRQS